MIEVNGGGDSPTLDTSSAYDVAYAVTATVKGFWKWCKKSMSYQSSLPHYHKK
jgi:hypothetical protein